ncbi:MAG TPA: class I SAM-dependent methyltransferase [Gemmatimonadales bacterium]
MDLGKLQANWTTLGQRDPLWAILVDPEKRGNRWRREEFFETGRREIDAALSHVQAVGLAVPRRRALDFGCGVGRLTQALAARFEEVAGIDIAASMIELAREYNRYPATCSYQVNPHDDLRLFPDDHFDFVYSNIVLQHMEPAYATAYIREFVRVLAPAGVLLFQLPSGVVPRPGPLAKFAVRRIVQAANRWLPRALQGIYRWLPQGDRMRIEMYAMPRERVVGVIAAAGARVVAVTRNAAAGPQWISLSYCCTK